MTFQKSSGDVAKDKTSSHLVNIKRAVKSHKVINLGRKGKPCEWAGDVNTLTAASEAGTSQYQMQPQLHPATSHQPLPKFVLKKIKKCSIKTEKVLK